MHIAIIGATGMLGQPVAHELIRAGFSVRIVARDMVKARLLFPKAELVAGDLRDVQSLTDALCGMDMVYLTCPSNKPRRGPISTPKPRG